jgi:uncharacterized protein (DUF2235 family)
MDQPSPKNIVICCDGTNNEVVGNQTNVLRLFRMLVRDPGQVLYYDAGVGTHADPTAQWPLRRLIRKRLDAAIGVSIRDNVVDAYRFLARTFVDGDNIFLFGFSRGAYTVRALAAMIKRCGLLCPEHDNLAAYAWSVFTDEDRRAGERDKFAGPARIKKVFGRAVEIHFVGVWDTVAAFGWVWDQLAIPNTSKNDKIRHVRHAVSLDERRSMFYPSLIAPMDGQDCKEVWFAGVHADVGGGYADEEAGLARIALQWMACEAKAKGLRIDPAKRDEVLNVMGQANVDDALGGAHDEAVKRGWKLMSWIPRRAWSAEKDRRAWSWPNHAATRSLKDGVVLHPSVQRRIADGTLNYRPTLPNSYRFDDCIDPDLPAV